MLGEQEWKQRTQPQLVMQAGDDCVLLDCMEMGRKVVIQDSSFPVWQSGEAYKPLLE